MRLLLTERNAMSNDTFNDFLSLGKNSEETLEKLAAWLDENSECGGLIVFDPQWAYWPNSNEDLIAFSLENPELTVWLKSEVDDKADFNLYRYQNGKESCVNLVMSDEMAISRIENIPCLENPVSGIFSQLHSRWLNTGMEKDFWEWAEHRFRMDSKTHLPIVSGWCFGNGEAYFGQQEDAEAYCQQQYGGSIAEMATDDSDEIYHTNWDD